MIANPSQAKRRIALAAIALCLVGCTEPGTPAGTSHGGFDLIGAQETSGGIRLKLAAAPRTTQTLPSSWTHARFTLANPVRLPQDLTTPLIASGSLASATLFSGIKPGNFELYADTFDGQVRTGMGLDSSVNLTPGNSTSVTITLRTLRSWTAGTAIASTSGTPGFSEAGGDPAAAQLDTPKGLAFGEDGSLWVADSGNDRIRQVLSGTISTLEGEAGELSSPAALCYSANDNALFIADTGARRIRIIRNMTSTRDLDGASFDLSGGDPSSGGDPLALCYDSTNHYLYILQSNHMVTRIANPLNIADPSNDPAAVPVAVVGTGSAGNGSANNVAAGSVTLSSPQGLAMDTSGTYLYVADTGNHRVLQVRLTDLNTTVLAGTGQNASTGDGKLASAAAMMAPGSLAYDAGDGGRLYILDTSASVVRVVTLANGMIATAFGTGVSSHSGDGSNAQQATLGSPTALAFDPATGALYVSEAGANSHRVRSAKP